MKKILFLDNLMVDADRIEKLCRRFTENWQPIELSMCRSDENSDVEIIVTVTTPVDADMLSKYPNTRMISVSFTGYNHVDLDYCKSHGIKVYNVPAYAAGSVAELTAALVLSIYREIPSADQAVRTGSLSDEQWKSSYTGTELAGKTVGVIGTGTIGMRVAEIFRAFNCELLAWSRQHRSEFESLGGRYVNWDTVFSRADIVTIHLALNDATRGRVGRRELALMRQSAILINTARGPIVDQEALVASLSAHKIRAAGLDVYEAESLEACREYSRLDNVVLTPHIAYKTREALDRKAAITLENIGRFLTGDETNRIL